MITGSWSQTHKMSLVWPLLCVPPTQRQDTQSARKTKYTTQISFASVCKCLVFPTASLWMSFWSASSCLFCTHLLSPYLPMLLMSTWKGCQLHLSFLVTGDWNSSTLHGTNRINIYQLWNYVAVTAVIDYHVFFSVFHHSSLTLSSIQVQT